MGNKDQQSVAWRERVEKSGPPRNPNIQPPKLPPESPPSNPTPPQPSPSPPDKKG